MVSSFLLFSETRSGAAKRLFYLARALAAQNELSLICLDAGEEADWFDRSTSPGARFYQVKYTRRTGDKLRTPFDVPNYLSPVVKAGLETFIKAGSYDVVFCAFAFALSLLRLPALRRTANVVYLEDDLSFEVYKERSRAATSLVRKLHMGARWLQAEAFYRRMMPRVRGFIAISEEEAAIVRRKFPHLEVSLVGYGIPIEEYPVLEPAATGLVLGFIGNYIHQSNIDAMRFFLAEWYPALRRAIPGVSMQVAGKNLPADLVAQWRGDATIAFRENVPDLRDFYSEISIFVNPIVSQRGLRTKLVESAAYGRPIISTRLGAEGLEDLAIPLADSVDEFLRAFAELQQPGALARLGAEHRATVERLYSIEAIGHTLFESLARHSREAVPT